MNKTNVEKLLQRLLETKSETVKIGCDIHAREAVVAVQIDDARPLRPQKMEAAQLLRLVRGLREAGRRVYVCYETGPCGYELFDQLKAEGAEAYVIVAETLGDGRKQKTDKLDAVALCDKLDRYVRGNTKAMTPVRVPSRDERIQRSESRLRDALKRSRTEWEARGRSLMLFRGHHVTGKWWSEQHWAALAQSLSQELIELLATMREMTLKFDEQEKILKKKISAKAPKQLPKAIGALTWVTLLREVCDWRRFKNRRQAASFSGLCPGVSQSGRRKRDGSINRYGNPRVRALLIELVWRLVRWQPDYPPVRALVAGIARGAARRKCAVAAARRLAVDLWRLATSQTTPEKLKLIVPSEVLG